MQISLLKFETNFKAVVVFGIFKSPLKNLNNISDFSNNVLTVHQFSNTETSLVLHLQVFVLVCLFSFLENIFFMIIVTVFCLQMKNTLRMAELLKRKFKAH